MTGLIAVCVVCAVIMALLTKGNGGKMRCCKGCHGCGKCFPSRGEHCSPALRVCSPCYSLIDLPQPALGGFEQFISAWFVRDAGGRRMLVDPGPASTIPELCAELEKLTDGLDFIILTHIHLDHSGGVGQLLQKYPNAKILVSERGKKHLISPEKLWKASVETLGDIAIAYGEPLPIPAGSILDGGLDGVEIFETPGHAPHHISVRVPFVGKNLFFVGEAAGMTLPLPPSLRDTPLKRGAFSGRYLRPTTPPKFDGDAAAASLDLLSKVCGENDILCYAHFGTDDDACGAIAAAREQLRFWTDSVSKWISEGKDEREIADLLLEKDPLLAAFGSLPKEFRERELKFMENSLHGFIGWLKK